jgi:hypothetical protein
MLIAQNSARRRSGVNHVAPLGMGGEGEGEGEGMTVVVVVVVVVVRRSSFESDAPYHRGRRKRAFVGVSTTVVASSGANSGIVRSGW